MNQVQTSEHIKERKGIEENPKTVRLNIEIPENIRDEFQDAVERNGKSMKDVIKLYMQKYIWKQSELQRNRQKRRQTIG
jgi:metal-responsive CopG/Arc/MetJ family transcriptional regulator